MFARIEPFQPPGLALCRYGQGAVDTQGYGLHLRYSATARDAVPHVNYPDVDELDQTNELVVDLGPGTHYLNHPGEVSLVGGHGLWLVDVQVVETEIVRPHWHWLLRLVQGNQATALASHHELVGAYNGSVTMKAWDGNSLAVGSTPVPVMGPITVSGNVPTWVFSGWFG